MIDRRVLPDGRPVWIRSLTFNVVLDAELMPDEMTLTKYGTFQSATVNIKVRAGECSDAISFRRQLSEGTANFSDPCVIRAKKRQRDQSSSFWIANNFNFHRTLFSIPHESILLPKPGRTPPQTALIGVESDIIIALIHVSFNQAQKAV